MILGFKTHWGKEMGRELAHRPTYFVEKIWQSFSDEFTHDHFGECMYASEYNFHIDAIDMAPKMHTIRKGNRWKAGDKIHFYINVRQKNMFQFAPVIEVESVQDIEISHGSVRIDGSFIGTMIGPTIKYLEDIAVNDGFESADHFFRWFNEDFEGQIIHWTKLRY